MKRNKLILSAVLLLAVAGSAFAIKTSKLASANVYYKNGSSYQLIQCATQGTIDCGTTVPNPNPYYFTLSGGTYTAIPGGSQIFKPE